MRSGCGRHSTTCSTTRSATPAARCASSWRATRRWESSSASTDDGPGIDRELLPRLFEAFSQGADGAGGSGLGLSTVRAIAEAHGGGVSVGAGRERGTSVTLRLPLSPVELAAS